MTKPSSPKLPKLQASRGLHEPSARELARSNLGPGAYTLDTPKSPTQKRVVVGFGSNSVRDIIGVYIPF
jgi:hypothetical protein